jgi:hypothetical protein
MRYLLPLLCTFALLPVWRAQAQVKSKLAVMELQDQTRTLDAGVLESLTDALRTQIAQSGRFIVIDKSRQAAALQKLVADQKKESYKACYDSRCQIPLGQALAADSILRTKLTRVGSYYLLNAELVDLEKEAVTGAAQARVLAQPRADRDDRLLAAVSSVGRQLTGSEPPVGTLRSPGIGHGQPRPYDAPFYRPPVETPEQREAREAQRAELLERQRQQTAVLRQSAMERAQVEQIRRRRINYLAYGWLGIITGGILAASGLYYVTAKVSAEQEVADQASTPSELDAAAEKVKSARTTGITVTALGGAAVGIGALLVVLAPKMPTPTVTVSASGLKLDRLPTGEPLAGGFAVRWGGRF